MEPVEEEKEFTEDILETDVKPPVEVVIETDVDQKKTRNSPSKKIQTIEHRVELIEEEMRNIREYVRRLEDAFIYKIGLPLPNPPLTVIEPKKRKIVIPDETEAVVVSTTEKPVEIKPIEIPKGKILSIQEVNELREQQKEQLVVKKKRGRPPGSKNKVRRKK
jgi:hypothetical protein